ncbi:MAG: alpha/beta hydrolase [Firmicutes bacterium]|nr:alpha/beta hydrolase [Bacillota bacterium]MCL5039973.1 alpha/beta hydrolase [Bacillota bacterium]
MPTVNVDGVNIYYEVHGPKNASKTLLLIEGLGYAKWMWFKQLPEFASLYRTIIMDNRGVGESDKPQGDYSMATMARDAAGVLRTIGVTGVYVLGVSMGGFIAQEMALAYPHLVKGMILAVTSMGGANHVPAPASTIEAMTPVPGLSPEGQIRRGMAVAVSPGYWERHPAEMEQIIRSRLEKPTPLHAYLGQLAAVARHDTENRLGKINVPVLVIGAELDAVVPVENCQRLAGLIPGARITIVPGAGHLVFIEKPDFFNSLVISFIDGNGEV